MINKLRTILVLLFVGLLLLGGVGSVSALTFEVEVPETVDIAGDSVIGHIVINKTNGDNNIGQYIITLNGTSGLIFNINKTDVKLVGGVISPTVSKYDVGDYEVPAGSIRVDVTSYNDEYTSCPDGTILCNFSIQAPQSTAPGDYQIVLNTIYGNCLITSDQNTYDVDGGHSSMFKNKSVAFSPVLTPVSIKAVSYTPVTILNFNPENGESNFTGAIKKDETFVYGNTSSLTPVRSGFDLSGWYVENTETKLLEVSGTLISNVAGYVSNGKWIKNGGVVNLTARYTLNLTGTNLSGKATQVQLSDGSYKITLTGDITNTVMIPDVWGNVILDLNGKTIKPSTLGADGLVFTDNGAGVGTNLIVKNGIIAGSNGADGAVGGVGISSASGADACSLVLDGNVDVRGGNGGKGVDGTGDLDGSTGGLGGDGIAASLTSTTINNSTVSGGKGGDGGNAVNGTAGNGGNGGKSVSTTPLATVKGVSTLYNGIGGIGGVSSAGTSGSSGSDASTPSVDLAIGSVLSIVSESKGDANTTFGVRVTDLSVALSEVNATDSYNVELYMLGTNSNSTTASGALYDFIVSSPFSASEIHQMDVTVHKAVNIGGASGTPELLHETPNALEIFIPYTTAGMEIQVYRNHNGGNMSFTNDGSHDDGHFHVTADGVYLYSKYFSEFAIASKVAPAPAPSQPQTRTYVDTKQQGVSQILPSNANAEYTPQPTTTPTASGTSLPIPTSTGSKYPYIPTSTPVPVAGVLLGLLGGVAIVFGLRRKQQ